MSDAPRSLSVLVVDDEPLARIGLRTLLAEQPNVDDVREARGGAEAVRAIAERRPDLVLLDVQMPRVDGFGVIEAVGADAMPPVIFVTAFDAHALKAFEVHAVDYLLKPVDPARFHDAFERAVRRAELEDLDVLRYALGRVVPAVRDARAQAAGVEPTGAEPATRRMAVKDRGRIVFVDPHEIDWIEAYGNYVRLHVRSKTLLHRSTMDDVEQDLGAAFLRIRRSAMVRVHAIQYCEPWGKGSYVFALADGSRVTSSRYYRERLRTLFGE